MMYTLAVTEASRQDRKHLRLLFLLQDSNTLQASMITVSKPYILLDHD